MSVILDIKDIKPTNEIMEHIIKRVRSEQAPGLFYSRMYHRHMKTLGSDEREYEEAQP